MVRLLLPVVFFSFLFSAPVSSTEKCAEEKEEVDYWNGLMRTRVTEMRRTNHREAKARFLDCLGKDDSDPGNTPQSFETRENQIDRSGTRNVPRQYIRRSTPRRTYTQDVYVSSYHNFEGAKREAWARYYKESPECLNNDGDMKVFVKCANERKHYLKQFNQSWNEETQSLSSPISNQ